jgi:small-conductance mechanosensitive channel
MKEKAFVDVLAGGVTSLVTRLMEHLFGPGVDRPVLGPYSWANIGAVIFIAALLLLSDAVVALVVRRKHKETSEKTPSDDWRHKLINAIGKPIHVLIWVCGLYVAVESILLKAPADQDLADLHRVVDTGFELAWFAALVWLFVRLTRVLEARLSNWAAATPSKWDDLMVALLMRSLRVIVPVVGIIFALPILGMPAAYAGAINRASSILIILTVAWVLVQAVRLGEQSVLGKYDLKASDNLQARKLFTQIHFLGRTGYVVIGIFTIASILMLFEEVRRLGTSILASAGVLGVVAGLAAQSTIGNLFAGFQLAISQPMRIDDVLIVEGEWGTVEEITFTYVVLHIWDDRRLVIPLNYFIQKPFQNWTRSSAALMGSVILWADYSLPVAEVRKATEEIVKSCALWDKRFWNLQVSDTTEHTMQLRVLATAANSSKAWDMRCEIREKLIDYIQKNHPGGLPRTRVDMKPS